MVSNETEVDELPDSHNTGTFIGPDIVPDRRWVILLMVALSASPPWPSAMK